MKTFYNKISDRTKKILERTTFSCAKLFKSYLKHTENISQPTKNRVEKIKKRYVQKTFATNKKFHGQLKISSETNPDDDKYSRVE